MLHIASRHAPPRAARAASWIAAAPLLALAAMAWLGPALGHAIGWSDLALAWGAVLLGLMGGVRFGYALKALDGKSDFAGLAAALAPGAAGVLSLAVAPLAGAAVQLGAFLVQSTWDLISAQHGRLPEWAARLRVEMTAMAAVALLVVLGAVIFLPPG